MKKIYSLVLFNLLAGISTVLAMEVDDKPATPKRLSRADSNGSLTRQFSRTNIFEPNPNENTTNPDNDEQEERLIRSWVSSLNLPALPDSITSREDDIGENHQTYELAVTAAPVFPNVGLEPIAEAEEDPRVAAENLLNGALKVSPEEPENKILEDLVIVLLENAFPDPDHSMPAISYDFEGIAAELAKLSTVHEQQDYLDELAQAPYPMNTEVAASDSDSNEEEDE